MLLVAETGGKLIGYGGAYIARKDPVYNIIKYGHIRDMFVIKEYRRYGIAGKILNNFYEWFKKNKINYIELNVMSNNKLGKGVWDKYGFKDYLIRKRKLI